jgi:hypothetical protein
LLIETIAAGTMLHLSLRERWNERLAMQPRAVFGEAAENDACDGRRGLQRADDGADRDISGTICRKAVDACGDGRKGDRCKAVRLAQLHGAAVTGRERLVLAFAAALPDRADGMNDVPRRKPVAMGDLGVAGLAATKGAAFGEQPRPGCAMDCAIDPAAAKQRGVRGIDDGVNA